MQVAQTPACQDVQSAVFRKSSGTSSSARCMFAGDTTSLLGSTPGSLRAASPATCLSAPYSIPRKKPFILFWYGGSVSSVLLLGSLDQFLNNYVSGDMMGFRIGCQSQDWSLTAAAAHSSLITYTVISTLVYCGFILIL